MAYARNARPAPPHLGRSNRLSALPVVPTSFDKASAKDATSKTFGRSLRPFHVRAMAGVSCCSMDSPKKVMGGHHTGSEIRRRRENVRPVAMFSVEDVVGTNRQSDDITGLVLQTK